MSSSISTCCNLQRRIAVCGIIAVVLTLAMSACGMGGSSPGGLEYVNTSIENGCPLYWETDSAGVVNIYLVYDQERSSPNRANGHWHFQLQASKAADLTIVLHNFDNVWNGKMGSPINDRTICFVSEDGKRWQVLATEKIEGNRLRVRAQMRRESLYLARLEPYRVSDLERLKQEIRGHRLVEISHIGHTVEGRELEMIRIGQADAPGRVLLRARAHPWESGGNWVVQGMIRRLLRDDEDSRRYLARYCVYVMPMANKDGVVRGWTRFNMLGKDLNRNWDEPADPCLAPENFALESWLQAMAAKGKRPHLMIDLHNDDGGKLHVSRPGIDLDEYLQRMEALEGLLRKWTWFTEGSTGSNYRNPGTIGEGLLERYGMIACVLELNANWIAGLKDYPCGKNWELFGEQLCEVFFHYFESNH